MSDPSPALPIDRNADGIAFWIHVTPRAKQPSIGGRHADALRIRVAAPPVAGKANAACCEALARALEVPQRCVEIDPAAKHRRKRVRIAGDPPALEDRLRLLAQASAVG